MPTVNGKLILEKPQELNNLKRNIKNLAQKFEHLEFQMTAMSKTHKAEHLQKLASVQLSLQKLERIYSRLLSTIILTAIGLTSWSVWQDFNYKASPAELPNSRAAIASTKPDATH